MVHVVATMLVTAVATAQQVRWNVPPAGAVEYSRDERALASDVCDSANAARVATAERAAPTRYLSRLPPAPFVCDGELDRERRAVVGPVADLRDVVRAVACDLSPGRGAAAHFDRLLPFGDVAVTGSWSAPDGDGVETLRGTLTAKPPGRDGNEDKAYVERLKALCVAGAKGELQVTRKVDAARGVVVSFAGHLDLVVEEDRRAFRRLIVDDTWQFEAVRENQDFDFRRRVGEAIQRGTAWVRDAIDERASYLDDKRGDRNYGSGRLALALLTLLHGRLPADDEVVQKGFAELRKRRFDDAYSLAAALMAMAALHDRAPLDDKGVKLVEKWQKQLLGCVDPRVDAGELLRFNYTAGPRYDTSLQQYGLLGLHAADRCGVVAPEGAFAAAARQLLAVQGASGGQVALQLTSHAQVDAVAGSDAVPDADKRRAKARGFAYQEPTEPPFGSMSAAGTSGLLLALDHLDRPGDASLRSSTERAIDDGFAWLGEHFSVRVNPGDAERADNHYYYWLYCLERCCELRRLARLQGRDWYYEGGLQLLSYQRPDGSFRARHESTLLLDSTCFAVLFLSKSSAPVVITGR
ncbi:MAG: hypothetical protein H6835_10385 [Planctomycetes bacterium]|nr:hypothetical protein [Planctomycetota bacterium]